MTWFTAEAGTLLGVIDRAASTGRGRTGAAIALRLATFLSVTSRWDEWLLSHDTLLTGGLPDDGEIERSVAAAQPRDLHRDRGDVLQSIATLSDAAGLFRNLRDPRAEADTLRSLGACTSSAATGHKRIGSFDAAVSSPRGPATATSGQRPAQHRIPPLVRRRVPEAIQCQAEHWPPSPTRDRRWRAATLMSLGRRLAAGNEWRYPMLRWASARCGGRRPARRAHGCVEGSDSLVPGGR